MWQQSETESTTEEQASELWEAPTRSDFLLDAEIRLFETFDWPDHLNNFFWLLRGKKQVWFDYLALLEYGLSGAQLEEMLNRHGIRVLARWSAQKATPIPLLSW